MRYIETKSDDLGPTCNRFTHYGGKAKLKMGANVKAWSANTGNFRAGIGAVRQLCILLCSLYCSAGYAAISQNIAPLYSALTYISQNTATGQLATKAVDGVADGWPGDYTKEWATKGGKAGSWILLDEIPAGDDPEYTLYHADFGNGDFDFGVTAVGEEEEESDMHSSLDETAQPSCGWYLSWTA